MILFPMTNFGNKGSAGGEGCGIIGKSIEAMFLGKRKRGLGD